MHQKIDFSGTWHSKYEYPSSGRGKRFTGEHDVQFFRAGNELVVQSLPTDSGSYILLRLTMDDRILTGTWHEYTSPEGYYKGAVYYGAIQFVIEEDGNKLSGKWVGFTKGMHVESGDWQILHSRNKVRKLP